MSNESQFCTNCGTEQRGDARFCSKCGTPLTNSDTPVEHADRKADSKGIWHSVLNTANRITGENDESVDLHLPDLVSDVFKKHTRHEQDEIFICGTKLTTPPESEIASTWPKPWLYSRVLLLLGTTFLLLVAIWEAFANMNTIPGTIFIGALAVPFATLIFFFEVNAPRNISLTEVIEVFFIGGVLSIFASLLLFKFDPSTELDYFGAICTGIIEEVGKFLVVLLFCRSAKIKYILNGLLIGAAVGAGFAAFETAGYAFRFLWNSQSWDTMMEVILLRAFLAIGGHVIWAAISGAAYIAVKGDQAFRWSLLQQPQFLKLFMVPVVLHSVWDMPLPSLGSIPSVQILMTVIGWIFVLLIIRKGLKQISSLSAAPDSAEDNSAIASSSLDI